MQYGGVGNRCSMGVWVIGACGIFTGIKYLIIVITFLSLSVVYK